MVAGSQLLVAAATASSLSPPTPAARTFSLFACETLPTCAVVEHICAPSTFASLRDLEQRQSDRSTRVPRLLLLL